MKIIFIYHNISGKELQVFKNNFRFSLTKKGCFCKIKVSMFDPKDAMEDLTSAIKSVGQNPLLLGFNIRKTTNYKENIPCSTK